MGLRGGGCSCSAASAQRPLPHPGGLVPTRSLRPRGCASYGPRGCAQMLAAGKSTKGLARASLGLRRGARPAPCASPGRPAGTRRGAAAGAGRELGRSGGGGRREGGGGGDAERQRQHVGRRSASPAAPEPRRVLPGAPHHPARRPGHPADLLGGLRLPGDSVWGTRLDFGRLLQRSSTSATRMGHVRVRDSFHLFPPFPGRVPLWHGDSD